MNEGMMMDKSEQGNRVRRELEQLREQQLAKNRRDKLKDLNCPLTTPEEAQAFLAAMRDKSHQREVMHVPPSNLSSDGMDNWYLQQRRREKELRQRRREAEDLLRGYRGTVDTLYNGGNGTKESDWNNNNRRTSDASVATFLSLPPRVCDTLDDPRSFKQQQQLQQQQHDALHTNNSAVNTNTNTNTPIEPPQEPERVELTTKNKPERDDSAPIVNTSSSLEEEKKQDDRDASGERHHHHHHRPHPQEDVTVWRDFVRPETGSKFTAEAGRYHLYLSYACPGSHRVLIVRALKGLEHAISVTFVHPTWRLTNKNNPDDKHRGWVFGDPHGKPFTNTIGRGGPFPPSYPGNEPDPIFGAYSIREIYERANDTSGKYTIPLLWDMKYNTIVNNESSDIAYMLNSCFNAFARSSIDLYTEDDADGVAKLNEVCEWLNPLMIHGVYRCGFAKTQHAYDKAISELCDAFDRADEILQRQRYLTGDTITDADIRLFVSLLRFDEVYAFYFRANARLVMLTPSLLNFCREIYQLPGVAETCNMEQIKAHFFGSHAEWNKYSVIPRGLGFMELLEMTHYRDAVYQDEDYYDAEDLM